MSSDRVLAFDLETLMIASDVERDHAGKLAGESPWSRPDLFGFGCGVIVDVESGEARHYGPNEAPAMISDLSGATATVGYNSASFDLGVLSAYSDVEPIRTRHVDFCTLVRENLDQHPAASSGRVSQGGLDGLCRANGLSGKTGDGASDPEMLRAGKVEEALDYCEADTRLVVALYEIAKRSGKLRGEPYVHDADRERVYLEPMEVPVVVEARGK